MALLPESEYEGVFPRNLFLCPDNVNSMHFVILLKHMAYDQREELKQLLIYCGASLSFDVQDITDNSAIIVDHDDIVSDKAPAFKSEFIRDCLYDGKVHDISRYRQSATEKIAKYYPCMDVVYYRKVGWATILIEAEKEWLSCSIMLQQHVDTKMSMESFEPVASSTQDFEVTSSMNREIPSGEDLGSVERDEDVTDTHQRAEGVEKSLDKEGEEKVEKLCAACRKSQKVWLSRQRKEKSTLDSVCKVGTTSTSTTTTTTSAYSEQVQLQSGSEKVSQKRKPQSEENRGNNSVISSNEVQSGDDDEGGSQPKTDKKKFSDFAAAEEDLFDPKKDKKHSRMPYSYDEQSRILGYIIKHKEFSRLKGRELWMVMERRKVCPNRTWQSMKEHFLKKIVMNLEAFDFLSESDRVKFRQGLS